MTAPTNQIYNERLKLLADALNTAATSCFTIGIATPIAGYMYNVSGLRASLPFAILLLGIIFWLGAAIGLHLLAKRTMRGLLP